MIRLDGVLKTCRTRKGDLVQALAETSLTVGENEFVTLVGPSGCGKSTLLKLVAGLVPVTRGEIRVRDKIVREPTGGAHRNPKQMATRLKAVLVNEIDALAGVPAAELLDRRYKRLRSYGAYEAA